MRESLKLNVRAHWGSHGPPGLQRVCLPPFHLGRAEGAGGLRGLPSPARPLPADTCVDGRWEGRPVFRGQTGLMDKTLEVESFPSIMTSRGFHLMQL